MSTFSAGAVIHAPSGVKPFIHRPGQFYSVEDMVAWDATTVTLAGQDETFRYMHWLSEALRAQAARRHHHLVRMEAVGAASNATPPAPDTNTPGQILWHLYFQAAFASGSPCPAVCTTRAQLPGAQYSRNKTRTTLRSEPNSAFGPGNTSSA